MTREEFEKEIEECIENRPKDWRRGQAVFNYIDEHYGVARDVQMKDHLDCFFKDEAIAAFVSLAYNRIAMKNII